MIFQRIVDYDCKLQNLILGNQVDQSDREFFKIVNINI